MGSRDAESASKAQAVVTWRTPSAWRLPPARGRTAPGPVPRRAWAGPGHGGAWSGGEEPGSGVWREAWDGP